jgi:hypothetical protein
MRQFSRVPSAAFNGRLLVLVTFGCLAACGHGETPGTSTPQGGGTATPQGGNGSPGAGGSTNTSGSGNANGGSTSPQGGNGEVPLQGGSTATGNGGNPNAGANTNGGQDSTAGATASGGGPTVEKMKCGDGTLTADKSRPGYTYTRPAEVTSLLSSMAPADKIKQMFGIPNPANRDGTVYNDIERSQDAPSGNGKTVRGYW